MFTFNLSTMTPCRRILGLATALALGCALLTSAGCKQGKSADDFPSAVRVIDAVQDSDSLSALVDDKPVFGKVSYGDMSDFYGIQPDKYSVRVVVNRPSDSPAELQATPLEVEPDRHYTAVAYGLTTSAESPARIAVYSTQKMSGDERSAAEQSGKATVHVFNAVVGSGKIDLLVNSIVAFKNVPYGRRSDAIPLAALPYEWSAKPAGSNSQTYGNPTTLQLNSGHSYLVVVFGDTRTGDMHIEAFED